MLIWRCSVHASLDGEGGMRASARWHTMGNRITYCAANPSAALLEVLAHLKGKSAVLPRDLQYLAIDLPDAVKRERVDVNSLPPGWRDRESHTRNLGDVWLTSLRTAVLEVPSVLTPETVNLLLNPIHPHAAGITVSRSIGFELDRRLANQAKAAIAPQPR